jgi:hypothetical protein
VANVLSPPPASVTSGVKGKTGGIDNVTGKPVSSETQSRGKWVRRFFSYILKAGAFKGDTPPDPDAGKTHVIK